MDKSINYAQAMRLLSPERAWSFVSETLEIPDAKQKFRDDKLGLLREILFACQEKVPFHGLSQRANRPERSHMPSVKENVELLLSLEGGNCWSVNTAIHVLLTALGYDAIVTPGTGFDRNRPPDHTMTFVRGLTSPDSIHIADPTFSPLGEGEPVCMNFEKESQLISGVYVSYKYEKDGDWYIRRYKYKRHNNFWPKNVYLEDGFVHYMQFQLKEKTYDEIRKELAKSVFYDKDMFMNHDIMISRIEQGCFILLYNTRLKVEHSPGGDVTTIKLKTETEMVDAIKKYFPSIPVSMVTEGVYKLNKYRLDGQLGNKEGPTAKL